MSKAMLLAGLLFGMIVASAFTFVPALTGFSIATGDGSRTINLNMDITENTLIPLAASDNITSLKMTGSYTGAGSVAIHLVGEDETYHVATYVTPQIQQNNTILLGKGGTVIQLTNGTLNYTHIFEDACDETCEGEYAGPFYLQIVVEKGVLSLASVTYESPDFIVIPQTPPPKNVTINITVPPEPVERANIAADCVTDLDCSADRVCHVGYCISNSGHLNITNSDGGLVALFDKFGRVLLAGDIYENTESEPPENSFRIQNKWSDIAWIDSAGDLYLTGGLYEQVTTVPILGTDNFIIANPDQNVCVVQGATGDMYTVNNVVSNVLP